MPDVMFLRTSRTRFKQEDVQGVQMLLLHAKQNRKDAVVHELQLN
jgi:hypothetical protein